MNDWVNVHNKAIAQAQREFDAYFNRCVEGSLPLREKTDKGWIVVGKYWWDSNPSKHGVTGGKPAHYEDYIRLQYEMSKKNDRFMEAFLADIHTGTERDD